VSRLGAGTELRKLSADVSRWRDYVAAALGYFFDACRTCRVPAFARDLRLIRPSITAWFAAVFLARFHRTGAGNVRTGLLLSCCHSFYSIPMMNNARHYTVSEGWKLRAVAITSEHERAPSVYRDG
jgi:hypothetical protein